MKVGQLVKISGSIHEEGWPDHRLGIITSDMEDGTYSVIFLGSEKQHRFHKYFLVPMVKD